MKKQNFSRQRSSAIRAWNLQQTDATASVSGSTKFRRNFEVIFEKRTTISQRMEKPRFDALAREK